MSYYNLDENMWNDKLPAEEEIKKMKYFPESLYEM